ncbi:MAG: hypothetical protein WCJ01_02630 [Ignavibacteria bacterium]
MKWNLINTGLNTGRFNMDYDIELVQKCFDDEAYLRFYRWEPYCISLGANQKFEDIDIRKTGLSGIDVVKRPTGGRAILHAEELTYSVIIPASSGLTSTEIYRRISLALVSGLRLYSKGLYDAELETLQPDFASLLKDPSGAMCFASTAKSEVKFKGKKLIGSAQRKMGGVILQHGSILCGNYHLGLINYLNYEPREIELLKEELNHKTIDIESILNEKTDYIRLTESVIKGIEAEFDFSFKENSLQYKDISTKISINNEHLH